MKKTVVILDMRYRDGANFKSSEDYVLPNSKNLSADEVIEGLEHIYEGDPFIPQYFKLPTLAPHDNEFINTYNDLDHPYMELNGVKVVSEEEGQKHVPHDVDISEVIKLVKKGGDTEVMKKKKQEAIRALEENIKAIKEA